MRRPAGLILIALGAFFLTLAPLVRFYVADQVVQAPLNRYQLTRLEAKNASYLDYATLKMRKGVALMADNTVRGDVRANNGDNNIAVWDSSTNIFDQARPDKPIQIQGFRIAFDRHSAELVNCCGVNVDGDNTVQMSGYGLLFPIANVHKRDYPFYDMTTKQSSPMRFSGVEKVHGLTAYKFVQQIPLTRTATLDTKLPGRLLGLGAKSRDQKVDRYTMATNTFWVDPRSGIPVKQREMVRSTVQTPDGRGKMTVAEADLLTIDKDQKALVGMADSSALQISAVQLYIPVGSVFFGLVLLVLGTAVGLRSGRGTAPPETPRRSDGKFGQIAPPKPAPAPPAAVPRPREAKGGGLRQDEGDGPRQAADGGSAPAPQQPRPRRAPARVPRRADRH